MRRAFVYITFTILCSGCDFASAPPPEPQPSPAGISAMPAGPPVQWNQVEFTIQGAFAVGGDSGLAVFWGAVINMSPTNYKNVRPYLKVFRDGYDAFDPSASPLAICFGEIAIPKSLSPWVIQKVTNDLPPRQPRVHQTYSKRFWVGPHRALGYRYGFSFSDNVKNEVLVDMK